MRGQRKGYGTAEPCLAILEVLFEPLDFKSIGSIAIPGKINDELHPEWYHPDLLEHPNGKDFQSIAEFVDKIFDDPFMVYSNHFKNLESPNQK